MIEIGRVITKIAGRDAGKKGVIIDIIDDNYVLIDGEVRRRKCNIAHIEPHDEVLKIKKGASTEDIAKAAKDIMVIVKTKPKKAGEKPVKQRKQRLEAKREERKKEAEPAKPAPKPKSAEKPKVEEKPEVKKAAPAKEASDAAKKKEEPAK